MIYTSDSSTHPCLRDSYYSSGKLVREFAYVFFCAVRRRMHYIPATSAMIMLSRCISYALMLSFVYVYVPVQVEEESQEIKP